MNPTATSNDLLSRFDSEGYVVVRGVLDAGLIAEAQSHVQWLLQNNPGTRPEQLHHWLAVDDPFWYRLVSDDRLLDVAQAFIGPNIALFSTHYICKPPKTGQAVLWHQDGSYWPLEPMRVVTLWLAVTESTPANGCMRVIPRTHTLDLQAMQERSDVENVLGSAIDTRFVDETQAVDVILAPGDVSIHHPNIVHGSEANQSANWRMGLTLRYIPTSTRITKPDTGCPFLLRGDAVAGVNHYLPRPKYDAARHMRFAGCEAFA